jgi:hypothetical protein
MGECHAMLVRYALILTRCEWLCQIVLLNYIILPHMASRSGDKFTLAGNIELTCETAQGLDSVGIVAPGGCMNFNARAASCCRVALPPTPAPTFAGMVVGMMRGAPSNVKGGSPSGMMGRVGSTMMGVQRTK